MVLNRVAAAVCGVNSLSCWRVSPLPTWEQPGWGGCRWEEGRGLGGSSCVNEDDSCEKDPAVAALRGLGVLGAGRQSLGDTRMFLVQKRFGLYGERKRTFGGLKAHL
jgi:hypothetical protein